MIYKKLLEFQKQQITLKKKGSNPHFSSSYVPLNEVLGSITEPLNELGVAIIQEPQHDGLRTVLWDTEDDTKVECFMPYVEASTAQKLGSNNTYNRRYSLVTLLGLGDTDDDGNEASSTPAAPVQKPASTQQTRTPEKEIPDGSHTVTVTEERHGTRNGKAWQRVKTGDGAAWVNDTNGLWLEVGTTYEVVVSRGSIVQARPEQGTVNIDDIPF